MRPPIPFVTLPALLLACALPAFGQNSPAPSSANKAALAENYGKLPLSFEANQGQTDASVQEQAGNDFPSSK